MPVALALEHARALAPPPGDEPPVAADSAPGSLAPASACRASALHAGAAAASSSAASATRASGGRPMVDSTALYALQRFTALRQRLEADGYLLVRGVIDLARVRAARAAMLSQLASIGALRRGVDPDLAQSELASAFRPARAVGARARAGSARGRARG